MKNSAFGRSFFDKKHVPLAEHIVFEEYIVSVGYIG